MGNLFTLGCGFFVALFVKDVINHEQQKLQYLF